MAHEYSSVSLDLRSVPSITIPMANSHSGTYAVNNFIELSSFIYLFVYQDWFLTCLVSCCIVFAQIKL